MRTLLLPLLLAGCVTAETVAPVAQAVGCAAAAAVIASRKAPEERRRPTEAAVQAAVEETIRLSCNYAAN
jgi:hypothetical protein